MFIIKFMGGIGNQLYQLNFYYYLKKRFPNAKIYVNFSYYEFDSIHGGYMLDGITIPQKKHFIFSLYRLINDSNYVEDFLDRDDILFEGYWQNIRFLQEPFFSFFDVFNNNINEDNKRNIQLIKESKNSVSIHVRCGDYDNHFGFGNISTKAYYNNAIKKVINEIENPTFFVFSNNLEWTKENLDFKNCETCFITCNSKPEDAKWDLYLMSLCKNNIISNSSFSWWAQYFNANTKKKVITPPYWSNCYTACFFETEPDIQKFEYMMSVPNTPIENIEKSDFFSVLLIITDKEQGLMKLRRSLSTILNQNGRIPDIIIANPYKNLNIQELLKLKYSNYTNIYYYDIQNSNLNNTLMEMCKRIKTKYFIPLNSDSYLSANVFNLIENTIKENKDFDYIEFSYKTYPQNNTFNVTEKVSDFNNIYNKIFNKTTLFNYIEKKDFSVHKRIILSNIITYSKNIVETIPNKQNKLKLFFKNQIIKILKKIRRLQK